MKVELVNAEVLTVGPDETLIVTVPLGVLGRGSDVPGELDEVSKDLIETFTSAGIAEDRIVIVEGEVSFTKVQS